MLTYIAVDAETGKLVDSASTEESYPHDINTFVELHNILANVDRSIRYYVLTDNGMGHYTSVAYAAFHRYLDANGDERIVLLDSVPFTLDNARSLFERMNNVNIRTECNVKPTLF